MKLPKQIHIWSELNPANQGEGGAYIVTVQITQSMTKTQDMLLSDDYFSKKIVK
jgi:hypothetical protein